MKKHFTTKNIRKRIIFHAQMPPEIQPEENNLLSSATSIMITQFNYCDSIQELLVSELLSSSTVILIKYSIGRPQYIVLMISI